MFLSNQQWCEKEAAKYAASDTVSRKLLCEYYTRMAEVETPKEGVGSGEMNTLRGVVRAEMVAKAKSLAVNKEVRDIAENFIATCYIFADGSFLRTDVFA